MLRVLIYTIVGIIVGMALTVFVGGRITNLITPLFGSHPDYIGSIPVTVYNVPGLYVFVGVTISIIAICAIVSTFIGSKLNKK